MRDKKRSNFGDKIGRNVQHQKESKKSFGYLNLPKGVPVLSFEGDTQRVDLDFLPYEVTDVKHPDQDPEYDIATKGSLWYRRPFKVHRNVGANNDTVVCLRSVGKKCPICDYREKRAKEGADKEELRELYGKPRSLYVVIPLGIKKYEEVPTIWDMSDKLFQEILNDELSISEEDRCFPDLENGRTTTLKLRWKSLGGNSYPEVRSISFSKRDPYPETILDDVPNLDEVLKLLSYETMQALFHEEEVGGSLNDVSDEEKPVRRERVREEKEEEEKPTRRRPAPESEPEEERPVRRSVKEEDPPEEKVERRMSRSAKSSDPECPHGHEFGKDTEKFKECDTCDIWGKCLDKKEGK